MQRYIQTGKYDCLKYQFLWLLSVAFQYRIPTSSSSHLSQNTETGKLFLLYLYVYVTEERFPSLFFRCDLRYIMVMVQELNILKVIGVDMVIIPPA